VFTGSVDGLVKQWHAENGDIIRTFSVGNPVTGLSAAGARLFISGSNGLVSQYNLISGNKTMDYEVNT